LKVDKKRQNLHTGICVHVEDEGEWKAVDISQLEAASLLEWLKSRGESNKIAENVVGLLLGHGRFYDF